MNIHVTEFVRGPYGDSCHNMAEPRGARIAFEKAVGIEQLILVESIPVARACDSTVAAGWY